MFFVIIVLRVFEGIASRMKKILRKGKELVAEAFVANTNVRSEYGRVVLQRTHPFTSSSDVLQAALQCNVDFQSQDRAMPVEDEEDVLVESPVDENNVVYGCRTLSVVNATCVRAFKSGMRQLLSAIFTYQGSASFIISA